MKLSMSMVQWYLKDFTQISHIQNDTCTISGLRFLSGNMADMLADFMYLGKADDYISDIQYSEVYIVVHQKNYILFYHADFEDLLNNLLGIFYFFEDWEHRMFHASTSGLSLQQIIDISCEVLCNPVTVIDLEGNIISVSTLAAPEDDFYWEYKRKEGREHPAILNTPWFSPDGTLINELSRTPQIVQNVQEGQSPLIMLYLIQDEEPVAVFYTLVANRDLLLMNLQMMNEISKYLILSEEFLKKNVQLRSTENLMGNFLNGKLEHDSEGESAAAKLQKATGSGQWRLALIRHLKRSDRLYMNSMLRTLKKSMKVPCIFHEDYILFLLSDQHFFSVGDELKQHLSTDRFCLALSMPSTDFYSLPLRFEQAKFTMKQAGESAGIYKCEDFAFMYIKEQVSQVLSLTSLRHPAFSILEEYDRNNNTELRETLSVFLKNKCNILETAQAIHVHRNTVKYRITRIREITGISFEEEEDLQYLCISDWFR